MSTATSYSKLGYLMLKKESTAGTAVYPDSPIEILSESIGSSWKFQPVSPIAGTRSINHHSVKDKSEPNEGTIEMYADFKSIGHFLNAVFGEDTHTTLDAGVSEQSDWEPTNTLVSYTVDIKRGGEDYVTRYFGVRVKKATVKKDGNIFRLSIDVTCQRVFDNARVTTAASSGTALLLDQTAGLVAGSDSIQVLSNTAVETVLATLTVTTVTDENTLVVSTIGASLAVNDIVVIKAQTIQPEDYVRANEAVFSGGAEAYINTGSNAMQNLSVKTNLEDFEITVENDIEPRWAATGRDVVDRMPSAMLLKGVTVSGKFSQYHISPEFLDMLRENEQAGLRIQSFGAALAANSAASATGVLESDGTGTVTTTVTAADEDGNDWAILVLQGTQAGAATATLANKLITLTLSTTASNNAVATIATLIDGLANVTAVSASTGNVTVADNPDKVEFSGGRDANERELMRFDLPNIRLMPFQANLGEDDTMNEEIEFTAFRDPNDDREIKVRLRNSVTAY